MTSSPDDSQRSALQGRLFVALAAVMWSSSAFFSKAPIFDDWPIEVRGSLLVFWRAAFATIVLIFLVRRPSWSWRMLPMVIAFAAMNFSFIQAMVQAEAAAVIWLQMTAPVWVFLGSWLLFRERVAGKDWLMLACSMAGVGLILGFGVRHESATVLLLGLLAGLTYGIVILSLRTLRDHDSAWLITLNHLVTAVVFLPIVVRHRENFPNVEQLGYVAAFGALQMGIPYVLFARGVRKIAGHEASGLGLIEPVLVPVWVFLAWRHEASYEAPRWWTLVGGGLILGGLLLRYGASWRWQRRSRPAP